jgi:hypothetical protein
MYCNSRNLNSFTTSLNLQQGSKFPYKAKKNAQNVLLAAINTLMVNMLWRNWVFLNGINNSRKSKKICKMTREVASKNAKERWKCGQSTNLAVPRSKIRCGTNSRRLWEPVLRKRPELWHCKWILHHNNATAHNALWVCSYLDKKSITKMDHPPYSSDLAPCNFWLLPKLKKKSWRDKDLLTFLTSNAMCQCYCKVFQKTIFKIVSGSGTSVS